MKLNALIVCLLVSLTTTAQTVRLFKDPATEKFGFQDASGKIVIPAQYRFASDFGEFSDTLSLVHLDGLNGLVNRSGKEVVKAKYNNIDKFSDGLALVRIGNSAYGYIDDHGKEVIPLTFRDAGPFEGGYAMAAVEEGNIRRKGFIDKTGKFVVGPKYDEVWGFRDGYSLFKLGKNMGFVDTKGNETFSSSKYESIGLLSHHRATVDRNGRHGYIDQNGKEVIPLKYAMTEQFDELGRGKVKIKDQYSFIDTLGNPIKGDAGFFLTSLVNVARDKWVVVANKQLQAAEPVYYLTATKSGKYAAPFAAAITWQVINNQNAVVKEGRVSAGESFAFRVPADGNYTIQAMYDARDCFSCSSTDKPSAFTMQFNFNTRL